MSAQRILVATLTGFVAGLAVGLLVAPSSGSETRQRIADSASDLAGGIKEKIRNFRGKTEDELSDLGFDTNDDFGDTQ
ncbi:MAG TPA: YtxH domain-containing protein [Parafilimonas sp.]|jgi:gas vesicle protein|nr:YtxH domain-containing protein [Parafilimonas sp.]